MKILVLILARGGSKRLPNKNILKLGKKHLINWSIDFAKKIPFVCDILVSTDSKKIGLIAKKRGALVPWMRSKKLSLDISKSYPAALHAINWYENKIKKVDGVMFLQPTSPFRRLKTINKCISIFKKNKSFRNNNTFPLVCRTIIESIDIDTKDDLNTAKKFVNFKFN